MDELTLDERDDLAAWRARLEERVLAPLRGTGWRYYAWLAFLLAVLGWALYAYSRQLTRRAHRHQPARPHLMGAVHRQFCLLHRHQPRRYTALGHPAGDTRTLANVDHAHGGIHHGRCADGRGAVPGHRHGPARPPREHAALWTLAISAHVGHPRDPDLPDGQPDLPVPAAHSRFRPLPGSPGPAGARLAALVLHDRRPRLEGNAGPAAGARARHVDHDDRHHPGGGLGAHSRLLGICDDACAIP